MQKHSVEVKVNGVTYVREVEARLLLSDFIRDVLGLKGTHVGCEQGRCGSCTVLLNGESVKSCLMLAAQAQGCEITTVEGLEKDGKLHPLQESFRDNHGIQCGFCTSGQLMNASALLKTNPDPSEDEIRKGIAGNICRCTGYVNIVKSIKSAADKMRGEVT